MVGPVSCIFDVMVSRGHKRTHMLVIRVGHEVPGVAVWPLLFVVMLGDISYNKATLKSEDK